MSTPLPTALLHPRSRTLKVLIPLFPDFNTFDVNGPIEVLSGANRTLNSTTGTTSDYFSLTIASATELTEAIEHVSMARHISLSEAITRIGEWDVLLVAGGVAETILGMVERWKSAGKRESEGNEFMRLLDLYCREENTKGLTLTICTGSLFLGGLGKLSGRRVTSHWGALRTLKELVESSPAKAGGERAGKADVVRARWIDSGEQAGEEKLPRLITAGGVSCGIDATFHLLDMVAGVGVSEMVAERIDYRRRGDEVQPDFKF